MIASAALLPRIALPRYDADAKDRNEERSAARWSKRGVEAGYPCIVCGTYTGPARVDAAQTFLHICGGGGEVADPREVHVSGPADEHSAGCLLFYPVGSSCLRKHPELRRYAVRQGELG